MSGGRGTLRHQLTQAAIGSALLTLSSKLLMLLTSVILARWMGAEGYGVYATAMALVALLSVPTALGLPTLTVRLMATYRLQEQWNLMRGYLTRSTQAVFLLSLLIAASASGVIILLGDRFEFANQPVFLLALALIPLMGLNALRSAALRGLHRVVLGQLPESLIMPGLFLALIGGWALVDGNSDVLVPQFAILARLLAVTVAFLLGSWFLLRHLPLALRAVKPSYELKTWARSAAPLLLIGGLSIVTTQTDVLMLAAIQGAESAGIYQAAARGAELVALSLTAINMAIQPTISRLHAAGEMQHLQRVVTKAARATLMLALPAALVLILLARQILGVVFGTEYEVGASCLAILCAGQLINSGAGSVGLILNMTGHERDSAFGLGIGALTNVTLNAALIPMWGIAGAALATALSLIAWNVVLALRVYQRLGLDSTALGIYRRGRVN